MLAGLKVDVNIPKKNGATPVFISAQNGHAHVMRVLRDLEADVNMPINTRATPVLVAAQEGHMEVVRLLHAMKADLEAQDCFGATPAFVAAMDGNVDMVRLLHDLKADVTAADHDGRTPLSASVYGGHFETAKALLLLGVPVSIEGLKQQGDAAGDAGRLRGELAAWVAEQEATNRTFHSTVLFGCTAHDSTAESTATSTSTFASASASTEQPTADTQLSKLAGLGGVREEVASMLGVAVGVELGRIRAIGRTIAAVDWTAHDEDWDGPITSSGPVSEHPGHSH